MPEIELRTNNLSNLGTEQLYFDKTKTQRILINLLMKVISAKVEDCKFIINLSHKSLQQASEDLYILISVDVATEASEEQRQQFCEDRFK
jgi:hypothetical protein